MSNDAFVILQPQPFAIPSAYGLPGSRGPAGTGNGPAVLNIKDFGALCDATASDWTNPATVTGTDDSSAIASAVSAAAALGGATIFIPAHTKCASAINLDSKFNIRLVGIAGNGAGYHDPPPAQLIYTGTGSSPFISAAHTNGIAIENLGIRYTSSSFTGDLIALTNLTTGADAAFGLVERCLIGGIGVHTARSCISLEGAILCSVVDNHLQWAVTGIRGQKEIATGNVLYSNAINITRNTFDNLTTAGILNPGQGWAVISNWFEGTDGGSGGMPYAIYSDISAASGAGTGSLLFDGNWLGDATAVTDSWVNFNHLFVSGLHMAGNFFNVLNASLYSAVKFPTKIEGASITGNYINSYLDFGSTDHFGLSVTGNFWTNDPINLTSGSTSVQMVANKKDSGFANEIVRAGAASEFGIGPGGGGNVTQATNRSTAVTINKLCGQIVLASGAGSATWSSFRVNNSLVRAIDTVTLSQQNDGSSDHYNLFAVVGSGFFDLWFQDVNGTTTETIVFNFHVHTGSSS